LDSRMLHRGGGLFACDGIQGGCRRA
jgi:hypothetical protein